jgi:hypothetical protein
MALKNCPECAQRVSDQAVTCPNCGYPLAQSKQPDLAAILCAGTWLAQSGTLVDAVLTATFSPDHSFRGGTRSDPNGVGRQQGALRMVADADFQGNWQVIGTQLFLDFPLTMLGNTSPTHVAMQFTQISEDALSAVDGFRRGWKWQRVAEARSSPTGELELHAFMQKQALLATTLRNLADMRYEMLKHVAGNLRDEKQESQSETSQQQPAKRKGRPTRRKPKQD